jgi:hypothetical protein
MRGCPQDPITVRFNSKDVIELECHHRYGNADKGRVIIARKIEIKNPDGSWSPYPSVTWLDGVEFDDQLQTKAVILAPCRQGFDVVVGMQGVPDGTLMSAAKEAGIHTEFIE